MRTVPIAATPWESCGISLPWVIPVPDTPADSLQAVVVDIGDTCADLDLASPAKLQRCPSTLSTLWSRCPDSSRECAWPDRSRTGTPTEPRPAWVTPRMTSSSSAEHPGTIRLGFVRRCVAPGPPRQRLECRLPHNRLLVQARRQGRVRRRGKRRAHRSSGVRVRLAPAINRAIACRRLLVGQSPLNSARRGRNGRESSRRFGQIRASARRSWRVNCAPMAWT